MAYSGSPLIQTSGSEDNKNKNMIKAGGGGGAAIDQKKRKRMESNRESARRSRLRKQKQLEDLVGQVTHLSEDNKQVLNKINVTTEQTIKVEAENAILKAQVMELSQRLQSLNEILNLINSASAAVTGNGSCMIEAEEFQSQGFPDNFMNDPWNLMGPNHHPIMASAEMSDY